MLRMEALARLGGSLWWALDGDVDVSLFKNTTIHESIRTQFRAEIFNLFNRTNLAPPAGYIGGGFGQSSDTIGDYSGSPGIGPGEPFMFSRAEDSVLRRGICHRQVRSQVSRARIA